MRNQFRAWKRMMTDGMRAEAAAVRPAEETQR